MAALWPATTAVVGVYEEPPPEGQDVIEAVAITEQLEDDQLNRQLVRAAKALTKAKDLLNGLVPG